MPNLNSHEQSTPSHEFKHEHVRANEEHTDNAESMTFILREELTTDNVSNSNH